MNVDSMLQLFMLALFTLLCCGALLIRSLFATSSVRRWYYHLHKPRWAPNTNFIKHVWALLFLCMAVAAWVVWLKLGIERALAPLAVFALQLGLNLLWSIFFLALRSPFAAFVDAVLLWCAVFVNMLVFWQAAPVAGLLLLPYLLWITYTGALNLAIYRMNSS